MKNFSSSTFRSVGAMAIGIAAIALLTACNTGPYVQNISTDRSVYDMQAEQYLHDINWLTYANPTRGFTFRYPKQVLNLQNFLCPPIPTTVIEDGDWVYVAPSKIYAAGKTCNDTTAVTKANIKSNALLAIASGDANDQKGVETFLQHVYDDKTCTVRSMSVFRDGPQQLISRGSECDKIPDEVTILFHPVLKKVLVYPQQPDHQVFTSIDPQKQGFVPKDVDAEVWGSIGFVK